MTELSLGQVKAGLTPRCLAILGLLAEQGRLLSRAIEASRVASHYLEMGDGQLAARGLQREDVVRKVRLLICDRD